MKDRILSFVSAAALLIDMSACQDPHEFSPTDYDEPFKSMTASFFNDDNESNSFPAEIDYENHRITIVIPYNYPPNTDNHIEPSNITHMRVMCNLENGQILEPALTWLDLSKENAVYLTDGYGVRTQYTIVGEIRKSAECEIFDFSLPDDNLSGVINPDTHTITIVSVDEITPQLAKYTVSHGATIDPDPAVVALDYNQPLELTVIAQNGVDKCVYRVEKGVPDKLPFGIRTGSEMILWTKKCIDLGIAANLGNTRGACGMGVVGETVVVNDAGNGRALLLDIKKGEQTGTIDFTSLGTDSNGDYKNYRLTTDDGGNIVVSTSSQFNGGVFEVWKMKGTDGQLTNVLTCSSGNVIGKQVSVTGNLDGDAIITASQNGTSINFFRWLVRGGELVSALPENIKINGYSGTCWGNADIAYLNANDENGKYVCGAYCGFNPAPPSADGADNRCAVLVDGTTNEIVSYPSSCISSNWVINAVNIHTFNNTLYMLHNSVNTFTWGSDDSLYLFDLSTGDLSTPAMNFGASGINLNRQYGAMACGSQGKAGNGNDVHLATSPDGFYLYILFEFTNGAVGCVRADCIDMK